MKQESKKAQREPKQQQFSRASLLIISPDHPESYSPAGERLRSLALASRLVFDKVGVLTFRTHAAKSKQGGLDKMVSLRAINFSRALPFPFSTLFDPVKALVLLVHGIIMSVSVKPSVIIASMPPLETGLSAWALAKIRHVKLIVDLRDDWESAVSVLLRRYFPSTILKVPAMTANRVYSNAPAIFVVTETIGETVRKRGISTRVLTVPNGADTGIFTLANDEEKTRTRQEYDLPQGKIIVVYSGSGINPYYRLDLVFSSIKLLLDGGSRNLFFVFYVYNGFESLDQLKQRLNIPDSVVQIRKPLPRMELARVLAACDIGLVPFDARNYLLCARSTKMYEYLSSGLFVVSSGPAGGELNHFFSRNPELGTFVLPTASNYADAIDMVVKDADGLLGIELRRARHVFIKENYDRNDVIKEALESLFAVGS